jgi:hypothetical protein
MRIHEIPLSTHQLDAALIRGSDNSVSGHRGLWYYDPTNYREEFRVGDLVHFTRFCETLAVGQITSLCRSEEMPKVCSRINSRGFRWRDLNADELSEFNATMPTPLRINIGHGSGTGKPCTSLTGGSIAAYAKI